MSIYGALTTAVSGLAAQARALGAISDNVANSQTTGFKRVDTAFVDFVNAAGTRAHAPGTVIARTQQTNRIQGTMQAVENDTALAVSGAGFLPVARPLARGTADVNFDGTVFFTRAGDFRPDLNGYLVNSSGYALRGWPAQQDPATGAVSFDRVGLAPITVFPTAIAPVATTSLSVSANVPAEPVPGAGTYPLSLEVFDALGNPRRLEATLVHDTTVPNRWFLDIDAPGAAADPVAAGDRVVIDFGTGANAGLPVAMTYEGSGTTAPTTSTAVLPTAQAVGTDLAAIDITLDYGVGPQALRVSLGTFGRSDGLTQFASSGFELRDVSQNGAAAGSFVGASVTQAGDVVATYDNGRTRVMARVPVVTFADPDALARQDGQAFTATQESGQPLVQDAGAGGAGQLLASTLERSNVDIASEFTKLIVAQRAYSANTRVISASDEMLAETLQMRR